MVCNLCGSEKYKIIFKAKIKSFNKNYLVTDHNRQHGQIVKCLNCSLVFVHPQPLEEISLAKYTSSKDEVYLEEKESRIKTAKDILKEISRYKNKGRILLDVGCFTGFFLKVAQDRGWQSYGIELSNWAVEKARASGLENIVQGKFEEKNKLFPDNFFDCISLNDFLEHSFDPMNTIKICYRLLKKAGLLFINTPNIESFMAKLLKEKWGGIVKSHLYYFSPKTIKILLSKNGFYIQKIKSHRSNFTLNYLLTKNKLTKRFLKPLISKLKIGNLKIPLDFKDRMEIYAFKT